MKRKSKAKPKTDAPLELESIRFEAGSRTRLTIPLAQLYVQAPMDLVVIVLQGMKPGPKLLVSAALHGDEINGIFSIRRIVQAVEPTQLTGTLILVPVVNVFGVIHQIRYLPDRRDLNRSFPGSKRGSLAANLAHTFVHKVLKHATHMVDLHTAAIHRTNWPQIRANLDDPETLRLAKAFGAHLMIHANERDGSLRQAGTHRGIPSLLFEGGAALRHDEDAVNIGAEGVLRVMQALGMYQFNFKTKARKPLEARKSSWVRAEKSGFFVPSVGFGDRVRKGQSLGKVLLRFHSDFADEIEIDEVSPCDGVVIGYAENPMVYKGDALVHVAEMGR